tara:strand:- start:4001 stop:4897 length:897 start_codon:yes stop_codon:yes gene_type:complete
MKKILYITDYQDLERFADKNRLYRFYSIRLNSDFECRDIHDIQNIDVNKYQAICISHETCPVHSRCSNHNIESLVNKFKHRFIILEDFQRIMKHKEYLYKHYSDIIVTVGGSYYKTLQKDIPGKVHVLTHHINKAILKDYGLPKIYDVLLFGTVNEAYPFRRKLHSIIKNIPNLKIKVVSKEQNIYGKDIAKLINQSWLTVSTKSKYNYLVCKYFEISAGKSVVLGNMAQFGHDIWNKNFIHVNENMDTTEIISIIQNALNDKDNLMSISNNMYDKIRSEYSTIEYAEKLNNIVRRNK